MFNYEMQSYGIFDDSRNTYTLGTHACKDRAIFINRKRTVYDQELMEKIENEKADDAPFNKKDTGRRISKTESKKITHALTRKDLKEARENFLSEEGGPHYDVNGLSVERPAYASSMSSQGYSSDNETEEARTTCLDTTVASVSEPADGLTSKPESTHRRQSKSNRVRMQDPISETFPLSLDSTSKCTNQTETKCSISNTTTSAEERGDRVTKLELNQGREINNAAGREINNGDSNNMTSKPPINDNEVRENHVTKEIAGELSATPGHQFERSTSALSEKSRDAMSSAPMNSEVKRRPMNKTVEFDAKVKQRIKEMKKRRSFCCC